MANDYVAFLFSASGTGAEMVGFTAGLIGEPTIFGEPAGFTAGTILYNESGFNKYSDQHGWVSLAASGVGDIFAGETYIINNGNEFSVIVAPGTQFSLLMAGGGQLSPVATIDAVFDGLSIYNSLTSTPIAPQLGINSKPISDIWLPPRRVIHISIPESPE